MNRPRLKSLLLGGLVALSLVLTLQLWYGQPPGLLLEPAEPPDGSGSLAQLPEGEGDRPVGPLLAARSRGPDEGWQGFGPGHDLLRQAWEPVARELEGPEAWPFLEAPAAGDQEVELEAEGTWVFDLPQSLTLEEWAALLGGPRYLASDGPMVRQLVVDPEGSLYWHDGYGAYYPQGGEVSLPQPEEDQGQTLELAGEATGDEVPVAAGLLVPADPPALGTYSAQPVSPDPEEEARRFFADMSLVREIRERDDAAIYTDGQRALRVYPQGRVEYSFPEMQGEGPAPGVATAWDRAGTFVRQHGGWPTDSLLWAVEREAGQVGFVVEGHYQGLPLLGPEPAFQLTVGNSGVSSFRYLRLTGLSQEEAARDVVPADQLLEEWLPRALEDEEPPRVDRAYLALLAEDPGQPRVHYHPVWWIRLADGRELAFCAFEGEPRQLPAPEPGEGEESAL